MDYSGLPNYYTHFVFVACIKSHNIDSTHIKIFPQNKTKNAKFIYKTTSKWSAFVNFWGRYCDIFFVRWVFFEIFWCLKIKKLTMYMHTNVNYLQILHCMIHKNVCLPFLNKVFYHFFRYSIHFFKNNLFAFIEWLLTSWITVFLLFWNTN